MLITYGYNCYLLPAVMENSMDQLHGYKYRYGESITYILTKIQDITQAPLYILIELA